MKIILIINLLIAQFNFSQNDFVSKEDIIISGYVFDETSRKPIPSCNIYIKNSTIGTTSNINGYFEFPSIKIGVYQLIASHIGFEPQYLELKAQSKKKFDLQFRLQPLTYELPEVAVNDEFDEEWVENFETFKKEFLGMTENSNKSTILNPYEINFSDIDDTLFASCDQPIEIINNRTGYKIIYFLQSFRYYSYTTQLIGYPFFIELNPKSDIEKGRWSSNRLKTYSGSLRHFLRSISSNKFLHTSKSKMKIKLFNDINDKGVKFDYDSTMYLSEHGFKIFQLTHFPWETSVINIIRPISICDSLIECFVSNELVISGIDKIQINYTKQTSNKIFVISKPRLKNSDNISWIKFHDEKVIIDKEGRYVEESKLQTFGYFSKKRVADMLPFNFYPSDSLLFELK